MIWNWLQRRPRLVDLGIVAALVVATVGAGTRHVHPVAGIALGVAASLSLLWRRRHPIAVVAFATAATVAGIAVTEWTLPFPLAVALFAIAATRGSLAWSVGAASIAATAIAYLAADNGLGDTAIHSVFLV